MRGVFRVSGEGREKAVRLVLLVGVFAVCALAFQTHFKRRFTEIEARNTFLDETGSVSPAERATLDQLSDRLRERWGVRVLVHVRKGAVLAPEEKPDRIFVGVAPGRRQALVLLPSLVKKALPANFTFAMEKSLDDCTAERPVAQCAAGALRALERALDGE